MLNCLPKTDQSVPETYLDRIYLPLYARAFETLRSDAIFQDERALELFKSLEIDRQKVMGGTVALLGCVLRSQCFDQLVSTFLRKYSNCLVLNIGAGFCTRFARLGPTGVCWYDVDVPEVMEIRQRYGYGCLADPVKANYRILSATLWETNEAAKLPPLPSYPVLVLMEGVSMYLSNKQTQQILDVLRHRYGQLEVVMDVVHQKFVHATQEMPSLQNPSMQFCGGIESLEHLIDWQVGVENLERHNYLGALVNYPDRLEPWMNHFLPILKSLLEESACIATFTLTRD
jgi:O-methyltransferase involved in polyketide biosynthesis